MGFGSRFLKRTVVATLATLVLVAMTAAVYWSPAWAGYYLFTGFWTLVFLGLTPLIVKAFMFDRRPLPGLAYIAFKIAWLALVAIVLTHWSRTQSNRLLLGTALVAGVTTPLLVLLLRALGAMTERPKQGSGAAEPQAERKIDAFGKEIGNTSRVELEL